MTDKAAAEKSPSRLPWLILLATVFVGIAGFSALIGWAMAVAKDTETRRFAAIPTADLMIKQTDVADQIQSATGGSPNDSANVNIPTQSPAATATGASAAPPAQGEPSINLNAAPEASPTPPVISGLPWKVYAAKFNRSDPRPKVAIIIAGLGLRAKETSSAIDSLPPLVGFSFSAYASDISGHIQKIRAKNQEAILELPMEPIYFPNSDPGPRALLVSNSSAENIKILTAIVQQYNGYVGVMPFMGSKFMADDKSFRPIMTELKTKGLMFIDNGSALGSLGDKIGTELKSPVANVTLLLDNEPSKTAIDAKLKELEAQAKANGFAVGLAHGYPVSVARIKEWLSTLDARGIALIPMTGTVDAAPHP